MFKQDASYCNLCGTEKVINRDMLRPPTRNVCLLSQTTHANVLSSVTILLWFN